VQVRGWRRASTQSEGAGHPEGFPGSLNQDDRRSLTQLLERDGGAISRSDFVHEMAGPALWFNTKELSAVRSALL